MLSDGLAERYAQAMRDGFDAIRALLGGTSAQPGTASARRLLLAVATPYSVPTRWLRSFPGAMAIR